MAYRMTRDALRMLDGFARKGKDAALVPPHHRPALQIIFDALCALLLPLAAIIGYLYGAQYGWAIGAAVVALWLIREFFVQDDHALVRIYGPFGRLRYLFERVFRDKYLQYFNETNTDGRPIPRIVRDYIYQKAHNVKSLSSFGTELAGDDFGQPACRILHRNFPGEPASPSYGVIVGEKRAGVRPFLVKNSVNISAMSYGSLNHKACEALSLGAKDVAFVNTGEGGFGPHGAAGNETVFQIGTGKFGVGKTATLQNGKETRVLDDDLLRDLTRNNANIKMIQIKITQGAKPGLGGHLPGDKVTPAIALVRKVPVGRSVASPPQHAEFIAATPKDSILRMFEFIDRVRALTELPVGIKLAFGRLDEIDLLVEAMAATGRGPDAIQVDGADGGTGAGHNLFLNYVGYGSAPESVAYLDRTLKRHKIRDRVSVSASGKMFTPAHAALAFAAGAEWVDTARGVMLALGCIQSLKCHTNECPTGIATNSPWRMHGINIPEKSTRVHHYLRGFHEDLLLLTHVMGRSDPRDIQPGDVRVFAADGGLAEYFRMDRDSVDLPAAQWS